MATTLTEEYKKQLQSVHSQRSAKKLWGTTGARNCGSQVVSTLRGRGDVKTVLDFGAGQGSLGRYVKAELPYLEWFEYDPGKPGIDKLPDFRFDFIVSSDVLEHVEPECIDDCIVWMKDHARRGMFHHIACDPCGLTLPDGRNAHLIQQLPEWWKNKIVDENWALMYYADCLQRKRSGMRRHAVIQVDNLCPHN